MGTEAPRGIHAGEEGDLPRSALRQSRHTEAGIKGHEPSAAVPRWGVSENRKLAPEELPEDREPSLKEGVHPRIARSDSNSVEKEQEEAGSGPGVHPSLPILPGREGEFVPTQNISAPDHHSKRPVEIGHIQEGIFPENQKVRHLAGLH